MASDYPWFPFYGKDWVIGTRCLTKEQRAVYMDLLVYAWDSNGLPTDGEALRRFADCTKTEWARIWPALKDKWVERGGRLVNERQERERAKIAKRSDSARASAQVRWQSERNANASANAERTECYSQSQSQPQYEREPKTLSLVAREGGEVPVLSPGQLQAAVPGLVGAWNNLCAVEGSPFQPITTRSHPKATAALRAHPDIDWWASLFQRVAASDFLRRDAKVAPVDFWWVLDHVEEIAAGRYDNRAALSGNEAVLARVLKDLA